MPIFELRNRGASIDMSGDDINYYTIISKLLALEVGKACGPDCIQASVIKECAYELALPMTLTYRASIETSELPIQWRSANVCPIFKKGDRLVAGNYRPVSLTAILCKVIESVVREKMQRYFYDNQLISSKQHGFVKH